jgi:hypothetical protein
MIARRGFPILGIVLAGWCLLATAASSQEKQAPPVDPAVQGTFVGNDKPAELHYAVLLKRDPWQDEAAYTVILTEKDSSTADKPEFDAMFGKLGHALIFQVTAGGDLFGTQICHQGLERDNISSSGTTEMQDFQIAEGHLSARFVTTEEQEFFGDRWQFDVRVRAPLPK